ncbi:filamentation induced by cAMP protein Fic [mine drainage metagenome]|uniref:Filamentation induced by cAMP protein Fic n=1 Tax=mine drainage metagenome TaxID=410659 RepID=T1AAP6_9ZZZZ
MAFIEKQSHGGHTYYYLAKSIRTKNGKTKKFRILLGRKLPARAELQKVLAELNKRAAKEQRIGWISDEAIERLEDLRSAILVFKKAPDSILPKDFLVRFTYNTNAIEGNKLTLRQTALVLADRIAPEGARSDDVIEALNSEDAWNFIKLYKGAFNKAFLLKVQYLITKNTSCRIQGNYRDGEVRIMGSEWVLPQYAEVPHLLDKLFHTYSKQKRAMHPVEIASLVHCKIAQIHPFTDGNGRTARLIMNWVLLRNLFPPVIIEVKNKERYYTAIEAADRSETALFADFVAQQLLEQYTVSMP